MQDTGRKPLLANQGIQERRLADTDAPEYSNMDVTMLQLVQHYLDLTKVLTELLPDFGREPVIGQQSIQAVASLLKMLIRDRRRIS